MTVNHAGDLIKKKLIRTNPSPDKALRFSHLYSRLLTQPVLNQKWAILYLLYQLSDFEDANVSANYRPSNSPSKTARIGEDRPQQYSPKPRSRREDAAFEEAFAPGGIEKLPKVNRGQAESRKVDGEHTKTSPNRGPEIALKTAILATNYVELNPTENAILRDLPFTLQGLSSTNLHFSSLTVLKLPDTLPSPVISVLHSLAEPSLLYKSLEAFVHSSEPGLLGQSLRAAIGDKIRSYLKLVAGLEGQIRQTLLHVNEDTPSGGSGRAGVTLKKMVVATREPTRVLRLLSLIAEESKSQSTT